jgi:hypothetical protein
MRANVMGAGVAEADGAVAPMTPTVALTSASATHTWICRRISNPPVE